MAVNYRAIFEEERERALQALEERGEKFAADNVRAVGFRPNRRLSTTLGRAMWKPRLGVWDRIEIAVRVFEGGTLESELRDVIRHEMAHVCTRGARVGHGPEFKRFARILGAHGTRAYDSVTVSARCDALRNDRRVWTIRCAKCGERVALKSSRNRPTRWTARRVHVACGGGRLTAEVE